MATTIEKIEIIEDAEQIASMILHSDLVQDYRDCLYRLQNDEEAQKLIANFLKMKDRFEEVQRFGKYHPDFRTVTKETRELKRQLDIHDTIAAFKNSEEKIQQLLDQISVLIGGAVSQYIKVPTGNPYFDSISSCGGGCGSGGSCGCK
ncbi:YlbF family regulator [Fredinandcohnia quinoae]|uniref:YlbF family regulator n=1 Tax=Fredinandcohnia quinoae TaxID=2918902 RepID=A0AAW5DU57_9BACI|nr:YlbF family regulator [Fredinandcohnia sp. SECRCQ15]